MSIELKQAEEQALKELGEARKIIRASSSRQLAKDWDRRATDALANLRTAIQQAEAQKPATGEPVAALVRSRRIRTPADCAFDKKDHYSEWSDWEPCTLSYARAVTDPARDKGLLPLYEMLPLYTHPAPSVPATPESVYWEWRHLSTHPNTVDFGQWSEWQRVEARNAIHTIEDALAEFRAYIAQGYKYELRALYTHPAPSEPKLIEIAISSGYFDVLPVKATIPMCKAGWAASGGELTFQQIGHIYEEMYKARPLPDATIYAAPSAPGDVVRDAAQEAVEELHKLNEYAIVYINDPERTRVSDTCQKLIGSIDAATLAAKERS